MAETIRDVVIRIGLEQKPVNLKVPDLSPVQKAVEQVGKETAKAVAGVERAAKKSGDAVEDYFDRLENNRIEVTRLKEETVEYGIKSAEGFRTATDGAFTLARGLTFLGSSDEDMKVMVERIAQLQGTFDVFRGGVDLIKGTVEGYRALTTTVTAYSTAQGVATAAQAGYATATTASTAATNSFTLALARNPIGIIAVGLATVAAGALAYSAAFSEAADETTDGLDNVNDKLREQNELIREQIEQSKGAIARNAAKDSLQAEIDKITVLKDNLTIQQQIQQLEKRGSGNFGFDSADRLKKNRDAEGAFGFADTQSQLRAGLELESLLDKQLDSERQKLDLIQQQRGAREQELNTAKSTLQTIQQQLAAEKQKKENANETIGRLNAGQQNELKRLGQKVQAGKDLSSSELERLESLGGSSVSGFVGEQFRQRGEASGASDLLKPFGGGNDQKISSLQQQESFFKTVVGDVQQDVDALASQQRQREQETATEIIEIMRKEFANNNALELLKDQLAIAVSTPQ